MKRILCKISNKLNSIELSFSCFDQKGKVVEVESEKNFEFKSFDLTNFENEPLFVSQAIALSKQIKEYFQSIEYLKAPIILSLETTYSFIEKIILPKSAKNSLTATLKQELVKQYGNDYESHFVYSVSAPKNISKTNSNVFTVSVLMIRKDIYRRILFLFSELSNSITNIVNYNDVIYCNLVKNKVYDQHTNGLIVYLNEKGNVDIISILDNSVNSAVSVSVDKTEIDNIINSIPDLLAKSVSAKRNPDKDVLPRAVSKSFYKEFSYVVREMTRMYCYLHDVEVPKIYFAVKGFESKYISLFFKRNFDNVEIVDINIDIESFHVSSAKPDFSLPLRFRK